MQSSENINDILDRWHRRFQRAIAIYNESFIDEQFDDVVAVLVTGAFVEALLWLGIQLAGYQTPVQKKSMPLSRLIDKGKEYGLLDSPTEALLQSFNDIRNNVAHDIDYKLEHEVVEALFAQLPEDCKVKLRRAFSSILPEPSTGVIARLTFEQIVVLAFDALDAAAEKWRSGLHT